MASAVHENSDVHRSSFIVHRSHVGMACFLVSEAAFFSALIVGYLTYLSRSRPIAAEVLGLELALAGSACLLSSSVTVHLAHRALREGRRGRFAMLWLATIVLGALFLIATAIEWKGLIVDKGQWFNTNLFGTTYFTLVGFHAAHVTIGVALLSVVLALARAGRITSENAVGAELVSWYWHFVDGVWIVVFAVVYLIGR